MNLSRFSIRYPVTVIMVILVILTMGVMSIVELPTDMFPEITYPVISVITKYSGAAPEEVESQITQPLEEALSTITGVANLESTSQHALSMINLKFDWGVDLDAAASDVRDAIQFAKRFLPDDAGQPVVVKIDLSKMPIWMGTLKGKRRLASLKRLADQLLKPRLSRIDGVASLGLLAAEEEEILIETNLKALDSFGIGLNRLFAMLIAENRNIPGGDINWGNKALTIRTMAETDQVEELGKIPLVSAADGSVLPLSRLSTITRAPKKQDVFIMRNGEVCLALMLMKQSGKNTVKVLSEVNAELVRLRASLPPDVQLETTFDQSEFINQSVRSVTSNMIVGGVFSILVLMFFLRRPALLAIIGLAIPLSVIMTFIPMYFLKYSLNIMSLGGLALGVGMLVDNAIVVLENIDRHLAMGKPPKEAAEEGASEMAAPITGSTLTTIAVFIPFLFSQGIAAKLFSQLGVTISASLLASLFMALTLVPMMAAYLVSDAPPKEEPVFLKKFRRFSGFCMDYPGTILGVFGAAFLISIFIGIPRLGVEYIPIADDGMIGSTFKLPVGMTMEESKRVLLPLMVQIASQSEVDIAFERVGFPEGAEEAGAFMGLADSNEGEVFIRMLPKSKRNVSTRDFLERIRPFVQSTPGLSMNLRQSFEQLFNSGKSSIEINVLGADLKILKEVMKEVSRKIAGIDGIRDVDIDLKGGKPELRLLVNRDLAIQAGVSVRDIGETVRLGVQGKKIGIFRQDGDEMDIRLRGPRELQENPQAIMDLPLEVPMPIPGLAKSRMTSLRQFVSLIEMQGEEKLFREKQMRCGKVSANYAVRSLGEVMEDVNRVIAGIKPPEGYYISVGGTYKDLQSAVRQLTYVFLLGLLLVYMIMASQFESLKDPFCILFSVPLATIGLVGGLLICHQTLNVSSAIGMVILLGIVVNNAIVLVDYVKQLQQKGHSLREALIEAPATRLRPIMMTTITTVLGLVPLALGYGEGTEVQQPLAIAIIFGLSFSTVLTLFVVPAIYLLLGESRTGETVRENQKK